MKDELKTKAQLIDELKKLRRRIEKSKSLLIKQKRLERQLALYGEIVENLAEGVYLIRANDGTIVYTNPSLDRMFGYGPGELVGEHVSIVNAPTDRSPEETAEEIIHDLKENGTWSRAILNIKKDGTLFWCHANVSTFDHHDYGEVWISVHEDITAKEQAEEDLRNGMEEDLRESRELFQEYMKHLPGIAFMKDASGRYLYINNMLERLFDVRLEDWQGKTDEEIAFFPKNVIDQVTTNDQKVLTTKLPMDTIEVIPQEDQLHDWMAIRFPIFDKNGNLTVVAGFSIDITAREIAEREIASLAKFSSENPNPILRVAKEGSILYANEASEPLLNDWGCKVGQSITADLKKSITEAFDSGQSRTEEINIGEKIFSFVMAPVGDEDYVNLYGRDITERVRADEALKESEEKFKMILSESPDAITVTDLKGRIVECNEATLRVHGFSSKEEVLGLNAFDLVDPNDRQVAMENLKKVLERGSVSNIEYTLLKKDGGRFAGELSASVIRDSSNNPLAFVETTRDISDRIQAQELKRYKELFENVGDGILIISDSAKVVVANDGIAEMTGYTKEEFLRLGIKDLIPQDQVLSVLTEFGELKEKLNSQFEINVKTKMNDIIPTEVNCRLISYQGENCYLCVIKDAREKKLLFDQIIRSERAVAVGQLAASIAHEINSPLLGINSLLNLIRQDHRENTESAKNLDLVKDAFISVRNTVQKLLDLNRPGKEKKQPTDINRTIEDTVTLVSGFLKKNKVNVRLNLSPRIPKITASPQQIGQVFMNLINNAVEAMGSVSHRKGKKKMSKVSKRQVDIATNLRKNTIVITISDIGPGIPAESMEHIFDPFYTQKNAMGMGIGLSICNGIVEDHNGRITVANSPGGGAVFTIQLPVNQPL